MHNDLLDHAKRLVNGPAPLPSADARRAVSAAYYAAFHAISDRLAGMFPPAVTPFARRLVDHRPLKQLCKQIFDQKRLPAQVGGTSCPQELKVVADNLLRLYEARTDADYNSTALFAELQAREAISRADAVLANLDAAQQSCPDDLALALSALIIRDR